MKQVSVEYAHIYTNQRISDEHELSAELLTQSKTELQNQKKSISLVVMVDDYSFPDPTFNYAELIDWLETKGHKPDLLIRESQLIPLCDEVLSLIETDALKNQIVDYIKAKKYPCSLFIAAWYLLRMGKIKSAIFPAHLISDEILNILPESFKPFEDKGLEIISSTKFADCVSSINYRFIPGRLIA